MDNVALFILGLLVAIIGIVCCIALVVYGGLMPQMLTAILFVVALVITVVGGVCAVTGLGIY